MGVFLPLLLSCCMFSTTYGILVGPHTSLSDYLWQETSSFQSAAVQTSLIQGLKTVALDPIKFGAYIAQDAVYFYKVKQSLDKANARASDPELRAFLAARSLSYERSYQYMFKESHINTADGIVVDGECAAYINHLNDVATHKDPIYLVVALIPCVKLWPWLGLQLGVKTANFGVYNTWMQVNLDPDYHGYEKYETLINKAYTEGLIDTSTALEVYKRSMQGEVDFFNSV